MNQKEYPFHELDLPKIRQMKEHKKRLRNALLLAHQKCHKGRIFGYIINDTFKTMSISQKGIAFSVLGVAGLIIAAGVFGPSAHSIAQANAKEAINRAFIRLAHLSDREREQLHEQFQGKMKIKGEGGKFLGFREFSQESFSDSSSGPKMLFDLKERNDSSLIELLAQAKDAHDLKIVSADEIPVPGFFGRAGRAFGFKMTYKSEHLEKKLSLLPQDIRDEVQEHFNELHEDKKPVSFMVYTNTQGQKVHLGLNAQDEPIMVFMHSMKGEFSSPSQGKRLFMQTEYGIE